MRAHFDGCIDHRHGRAPHPHGCVYTKMYTFLYKRNHEDGVRGHVDGQCNHQSARAPHPRLQIA